jgi:hypothetical protein
MQRYVKLLKSANFSLNIFDKFCCVGAQFSHLHFFLKKLSLFQHFSKKLTVTPSVISNRVGRNG